MPASTRAFIKRGGAVCVAAAVLLGGTFTAGAATAAPAQDIESLSISSAPAPTTATPMATNAPSNAALPEGLAEAVERDLGLTVDEFNKRGALAAKAADIQTGAGSDAVVSLDGDTINVQTTDPAAATAAASDTEVNIEIVSPAPDAATSPDTLLADYIAKFGSSKLQSIMRNGAGDFVIRTGEPATGGPATARFAALTAQSSVADFAAKYNNVTLEATSGPATPYVDVANGQGYGPTFNGNVVGYCSIGWHGFNAAGDAAVISAGHCTADGQFKDATLTDPKTEPAVGGAGGGDLGTLGIFGFSQFGGPGNTPITGDPTDPAGEIGNIGTDISVIDKIGKNVYQVAKVTNWGAPAESGAKEPQVSGVSEAIAGASICKSGRTTGWKCGTVAGVGIFLVRGSNDVNDLRAVRGFASAELEAAEGDSGGSIIAGSLAVGMISAGIPNGPTYGVSLTDALSKTAGYSVKIFLNAPTVTPTAPVSREGAITGTVNSVPDGTTVVVTVDGVKTEVTVGADGTWSAKAPNKSGVFKVAAVAKNGFSESATATGSVEVIKETLPSPAITVPVNEGTMAAPVTAITGTGTAGATVKLTGDVTGAALVNEAGSWSVPVTPGLAVGNYTVTAMQTLADWNDSSTASSKFSVVYAAPVIVSPSNGAEFAFKESPTRITGTNVEGAAVIVTADGKSYKAAVTSTAWTVTLDASLTSGSHTITAVQSLDGVQSLTATSSFVVLAEPAPAAPEQTQQAQAPAPRDNGMDLASTGASSTTILLGAAGGLLLLGGAVFLLLRRRNSN